MTDLTTQDLIDACDWAIAVYEPHQTDWLSVEGQLWATLDDIRDGLTRLNELEKR